jgi:hypothetical protein
MSIGVAAAEGVLRYRLTTPGRPAICGHYPPRTAGALTHTPLKTRSHRRCPMSSPGRRAGSGSDSSDGRRLGAQRSPACVTRQEGAGRNQPTFRMRDRVWGTARHSSHGSYAASAIAAQDRARCKRWNGLKRPECSCGTSGAGKTQLAEFRT